MQWIKCIFLSFPLLLCIAPLQAREPLLRFSAEAYTGVYTVGRADLMVSLDGDGQHNLYVDPQGGYGTDQAWYGDVGLGYRWISNDAAIVGWYVFAGHSRVENSSGFWITNPGVEVMGSRWDARVNAYIPVAGRSDDLGGIESTTAGPSFFTGHSELRTVSFTAFNEVQQVGNGADARVGYQLFSGVPLKAVVGAYFFEIPHAENVRGGGAGVDYWFDDYVRVFARYNYDNRQHSQVVGGLGISFGGVRNGHWADPSLSERLTDPVERYIANLGHGSGIPSQTIRYGRGSGSRIEVLQDNIAFFSQTGGPDNGGTNLTLADCTFENPCGPTDFSQAGVNTLNTLLPNTRMYFNGGNYAAINPGINPLTLNNGQSVHSRTADYSAPATGTERSTFGGAFTLTGNNHLENIILIPFLGVVPDTGVRIEGSNNVITGSSIGTVSNRYAFSVQNVGIGTYIDNTFFFAAQMGIITYGSNLIVLKSTVDVELVGGGTGIEIMNNNAFVIDSAIRLTGTGAFPFTGIETSSNTNASTSIINSSIDIIHENVNGNAVALHNGRGSSMTVLDSSLSVEGAHVAIARGAVTVNDGTTCRVNGAITACA
ncbi:inverse autotransporter beta-barrel domain-containing protein [Rickettsiella grylli]|uniref:inverse autotransporter beta-barrel domain-containing protein n=1 Tax=Rickettsiella grylli TaxID=59196 RepID=UPI0002F311F6|nr:inverse autotransporter beta-barrel domain-containing protein [Rickettsiella grylli]